MEWIPIVWDRKRSRGKIEARQDWTDPWTDAQGLELKLTRSAIIPSKLGYVGSRTEYVKTWHSRNLLLSWIQPYG